MFLSMHNWMRAEQIGITIRRLAQCGYDAIEIEGEPEKYDTREVRNLLKESGISCFGSVSLMFEGRDLIHADEAVRASTVKYLKDCVTMNDDMAERLFVLQEPLADPAQIFLLLVFNRVFRIDPGVGENKVARHDQVFE